MGFFGTYLFDGTAWSEVDPENVPELPEPWLFIDIHDSDVGTIAYAPAGPGTGVAYLGYTPRSYFGDEEASAPTDVEREARGLATWSTPWLPEADAAVLAARVARLEGFLAIDDPVFDDDADATLDEEDVFVEFKSVKLLRELGVPVPIELQAMLGDR
jgi:hypothetical protein